MRVTTTRDPRRMIRDAAEFDRRQSGVRPYSEREMREALEMRARLRRRDDRIISAFETSGTTPSPPNAPAGGVSGTVVLAAPPSPSFGIPLVDPLDGCFPWSGCKFRGSVPDHPNFGGIGMGSGTSNVGGTAADGAQSDGDSVNVTATAGVGNYITTASTGLTGLTMTERRYIRFFGVVKLAQLDANFRFFFGGANAGIAAVTTAGVDNPDDPCMLIRMTGGVNWQLYTSNGGGDGGTATNLLAATANVLTFMFLAGDVNGVYARVWTTTADSGWVSSGGTLPAATTVVGTSFGYGLRNSSAGDAKTAYVYIQQARAR